jgi:hypothetical protein
MTYDSNHGPVIRHPMRERLVRLMDALARGAAPPGMIDIVRNRESHLRRRFAMIARFDGKSGRWSATGIALSLLIGGVALTGAVSGQDAGPAAAGPNAVADAVTPQRVPADRGTIDYSVTAKVDPQVAEKLWKEKYAGRIVEIAGVELNRGAVDAAYIEDLGRIAAGKAPAADAPKTADVARLDPGAAAKIWADHFQDKLFFVNGKPANRRALEQEYVTMIAHSLGFNDAARAAAEEALKGLLLWRAGAGDADAIQELWETRYKPRVRRVDGKPINQQEVEAQFKADLRQLELKVGPEGSAGGPDRTGSAQAAPAAGGGDAVATARPATKDGGPSFPPAERVEDEDVDRAVLAQLDRPVPEVNFEGAPLSDAVDFLRDVSGMNLIVEWGPLAAAGLEKSAPVSLRLKNVKFGRVLDLVLSSAGGGTVPIGYTLDGNIIRISTGEYLDRLTDIRAYDVRDVVPAEMSMQELTKLIKEAVAPDTWWENGGSVGTVHASKHKLLVKQTPMNHREVRNVLRMLREDPTRIPQATDAASAAQAPTVDPARSPALRR